VRRKAARCRSKAAGDGTRTQAGGRDEQQEGIGCVNAPQANAAHLLQIKVPAMTAHYASIHEPDNLPGETRRQG
jgi:hypothetical protein